MDKSRKATELLTSIYNIFRRVLAKEHKLHEAATKKEEAMAKLTHGSKHEYVNAPAKYIAPPWAQGHMLTLDPLPQQVSQHKGRVLPAEV